MANCQVVKVIQINWNGLTIVPVTKTAKIKPGGELNSGGVTDAAGKHYPGSEMKEAEIECEIPRTADFNPDDYRGQCGDLTYLLNTGISYLVTNASFNGDLEDADGDGKVKLSWKGDAATLY